MEDIHIRWHAQSATNYHKADGLQSVVCSVGRQHDEPRVCRPTSEAVILCVRVRECHRDVAPARLSEVGEQDREKTRC